MDDRLLFIIGSPRSGSTLLARMLGAHPEIFAPAEPHLLTPLAHLGYFDRVDEAPYDPVIAQGGIRELVEAMPGGETAYVAALRRYTDAVYAAMREASGARYLLDKTPAYALVLPFVAKLYPRARYIVLTRHPLAVWSSYVESFFDGDHDTAHAFNPILERYVPAIGRFLREASVPQHQVRYEQLVADPEGEMRRLCDFVEVDFVPQMVDYGDAGEVATARGLGDPMTVASQSRPTTASLSRWAADLAGRPEALARCRHILDALEERDLETWGFARADISAELDAVDAQAAGRRRRRPLSRHVLERRLLVALRRNIHHNAFGRLVARVRRVCDVLLR